MFYHLMQLKYFSKTNDALTSNSPDWPDWLPLASSWKMQKKKKALVLSWSSLLNTDKCLSTQIYLTQSVHDSLTWLSHVVSTMGQKEPRPLLGYTSKTASTPPLPLCGPLTWPLCFERWAPFFLVYFCSYHNTLVRGFFPAVQSHPPSLCSFSPSH